MKWWATYRILREMRAHLKWSSAVLQRYRFWKLREIVRHAYYYSPFYRQFYDDHRFHPDQLRAWSDLRRIPLLAKRDLLVSEPGNVCTLKSEKGVVVEFTSGSTGEALRIWRTWRDLYQIKAKIIRAFQQTGFRFYQRQAVLKSSTASLTGSHWFEKFGVLRKYWLAITDAPEVNYQKLRRIKPQHVHGYPSGLLQLGDWLEANKKSLRIPIICCGAEVLDEPMRYRISQAFGAEVFDLYGTREVGNVAWECRAHQGQHCNDDALIVEIVDEDGNEVAENAEGEIVVTYLDAYDTPFIRYRLGDRARWLPGECPCGVPFRRLGLISGRSDSRIKLPSGDWIAGMVFQELRTLPNLAAFRIIQEESNSIRLQVVPRDPQLRGDLEAIRQCAVRLVQGALEVKMEVVPVLEPDAGGKLRAVICKL